MNTRLEFTGRTQLAARIRCAGYFLTRISRTALLWAAFVLTCALGARSGNFGPEHVMASGALPRDFPTVQFDRRASWDGGFISDTPVRHVVEHLDGADVTTLQVDLFNARGPISGARC